MKFVKGKHKNSLKVIHNGYSYIRDPKSPSIFRCSTRKTTLCKAKLIMKKSLKNQVLYEGLEFSDDEFTTKGIHHDTLKENLDIWQSMFEKMKQLARHTTQGLKSIFIDVCKTNPEVAKNHNYASVASMLCRARRDKRSEKIQTSKQDKSERTQEEHVVANDSTVKTKPKSDAEKDTCDVHEPKNPGVTNSEVIKDENQLYLFECGCCRMQVDRHTYGNHECDENNQCIAETISFKCPIATIELYICDICEGTISLQDMDFHHCFVGFNGFGMKKNRVYPYEAFEDVNI